MRQFTLTGLLAALFAFSSVPASAQGCGLPTSGNVAASATYTLTADCALTDTLSFGTVAENASKIDITINGGGYSISGTTQACGGSGRDSIVVEPNVAFNLNNVTIKNGGRRGGAALTLRNSEHSAALSNVTFLQTICTALRLDNETGPAVTHSLSNLLFEGVSGEYYSTAHGIPAALHTIGPVSLNINNIALRGIFSSNSAIGANDRYIRGGTAARGRLTFSGCLTVDGVFPRVWYGDIVDNSAGACSGTVGNGGSSEMQFPQAPVSDCGLPLGGFIYGKRIFNLKGDCAPSSRLWIPYESDVVINGNRYTINGSGAPSDIFAVAGKFKLSNAVVSGVNRYPILTYLDRNMRVSNSIFRDNAGPLVIQDSNFSLEDTLIENHQQSSSNSLSGIFMNLSARVTVRDSVLRNNAGGLSVIYTGRSYQYGADPVLTLEGCTAFEGNSPRDILDPSGFLIDNRTGPCPPDKVFLVTPTVLAPAPAAPAPAADSSGCNPHNCPPPQPQICERQSEIEALPLGDIACIFRYSKAGETVVHVYEIDRESKGFHQLTLTNSQAAALQGEQIVAVSADGRVLAVVWPDDNITIKAGPNYEGKIAHITFAGGLGGGVIDMRTTYGPAPGLPYTNLALPHRIQSGQAAQPVAQAAAPLDCMVTTQYILNLRDAPGGEIIGGVPHNATLTALERTSDWFKIDYLGERGWLSADYVTPTADCG